MARYRDKKTGRFVAASTWRRSRAHGGKRYVRQRAVIIPRVRPKRKREPLLTMRPAAPPSGILPRVGVIPAEFLVAEEDYFEAGYESEEEEEYP